MTFHITPSEIMETIRMVDNENFDIRTITLGISLFDCAHENIAETAARVYEKITRKGENLVAVGNAIAEEYGIPIINKRISVTPISLVAAPCKAESYLEIGMAMERAARSAGVNFIGGFSALVQKGMTESDLKLLKSIPEVLSKTERVCSSVNVGSTKAGINLDAVKLLGPILKETARLTADQGGLGCAKLVVFCNAPEDNPFMAGAFHGAGEPEVVVNVGISGPGVILNVVKKHPNLPIGELADQIKRTTFKITRMGELVGRETAKRLDVPFGIVDLSLAPTPAQGDSVAEILEAMGLERCGTHGTTAALAILNDAVKKGGAMATSYVGGLTGAFIPVSEDSGMIRAAKEGTLQIDKLEAMTSVCSVGLDMIAVPGDTPASTLSAIIADEMAIGMINKKTTAVRIIPVPGKQVGEEVEFGGLLGKAPIMPVHKESAEAFIARGGRIPAPIQSMTN